MDERQNGGSFNAFVLNNIEPSDNTIRDIFFVFCLYIQCLQHKYMRYFIYFVLYNTEPSVSIYVILFIFCNNAESIVYTLRILYFQLACTLFICIFFNNTEHRLV